MFREMRRKRQQLPDNECIEILESATSGVLAALGDEDYPYAVPLSYVYADGKIYFHCAKTGHKLDAIKKHNKASFCVIARDEIVPERYTTHYKSVIAFGKARILENASEIRESIELLAKKYNPTDTAEHRSAEIEREYSALCMIELKIEHLTGKECIELTRQRES